MGLWCRRGDSSIKLTFRSRDKPDGGGNRRGCHNDEEVMVGHYDPADGSPDRAYITVITGEWR